MSDRLSPQEVVKKHAALKSDRGTWEEHWDELAYYIVPNKDHFNKEVSPGEKKNVHLFDNTAIQANELLAGALHSLLTNPHTMWFSLATGEDDIDNIDGVRKWLQGASRRMHSVLNKTNFQTEIHETYLDLGAFGTAPLYMEEMDDDMVVRFQAISVAFVVIGENPRGFADECYVEYQMSANQIVEMFGEENVSEVVLKAFREGSSNKFKIIHAVYPRARYGFKTAGPMAYVSQHVLIDGNFELRNKGYREFPFMIPRWSKVSNEVYGRCPGMTALPEVKTINEVVKTTLKGAQKVVDPPIQVPDDGFVLPILTKPASINYYRAGSNDIIRPIFNDSRIDFGFQFIEEKRKRIRESFYADQLILAQGPQMTATEVMQRSEENMRLLGPILGRMQSELLKPMVDRLFAIMFRRDMFDPVPPELEGMELEVKYSSTIARAQRVGEAQNIMRTMEAAAPFINLNPAVADNFNGDEAVRIIASVFGAPQQIIQNVEVRDSIREQRAQAQQAMLQEQQRQQQVQEATQIAGVVQ